MCANQRRIRRSGVKVLRYFLQNTYLVLFSAWHDEGYYDKVAKFTLRTFTKSPLFFRDKGESMFLPHYICCVRDRVFMCVYRAVVNVHGASFVCFRVNNTALLFISRAIKNRLAFEIQIRAARSLTFKTVTILRGGTS